MRHFLPLTATLLLVACASAPPPPEWQSQSFSAIKSYTAAYLSGNTRVAEVEFERAKAEVARTGRPDLMARIELLRCATQVASLVMNPCAGYRAVAQDAAPAEQAYASFIAGRWDTLQAAQLPMHYHALVTQTQAQVGQTAKPEQDANAPNQNKLNQIEDPLARLVAAGALIQTRPLSTTDINLAVETASGQGWRRPLLAWLGVQLKRHQTIGNAEAAAGIQRRIDLVSQKN
ncbi:MAG: hypothetical protein A2461_05730 [Burkholderiales bacterium RIFOXYC2_FULL_59_8]|nr:MAG: hypothetical protein A2461_05730 [Burkholderiales bacterium RIFOXYC2_FULL_59_8]OGB59736.1 MAG: hypothetical protein A2503_14000 [Burkholderiales bacterium RIFOXYD12_FULL_59_19]